MQSFFFLYCKSMNFPLNKQFKWDKKTIFAQKDMIQLDLNTFSEVQKPIFILQENLLRRNLILISDIAKRADVEIILAFKAYALWKTFPIFREYISATTASSLYEARLGFEEFGSPTHTFSPAYTDYEIDDIARFSSHISFNSMAWRPLPPRCRHWHVAVTTSSLHRSCMVGRST